MVFLILTESLRYVNQSKKDITVSFSTLNIKVVRKLPFTDLNFLKSHLENISFNFCPDFDTVDVLLDDDLDGILGNDLKNADVEEESTSFLCTNRTILEELSRYLKKIFTCSYYLSLWSGKVFLSGTLTIWRSGT